MTGSKLLPEVKEKNKTNFRCKRASESDPRKANGLTSFHEPSSGPVWIKILTNSLDLMINGFSAA